MFSVQQWAAWLSKGSASIPYVLLENYKKLRLTDEEMMVLIHLHSFICQGITFPSIEQLQERVTCSPSRLTQILNRLHKDRFLTIESSLDKQGKLHETYNLAPLWEKLTRYLALGVQEETAVTQDTKPAWPDDSLHPAEQKKLEQEIFKHFEAEFGRPLSPMECETITLWLDEDRYEAQMIYLALREAVISNKLSLRYIDRILMEWHKHGLKTLDDVRQHTKKFRQHQLTKRPSHNQENKAVSYSFYNWLEK